jgi:CheY-like chemotaxis protein
VPSAPQRDPRARILVAEDNYINQQVAVEMLAKLGYATDVAADGEQALGLVRSRHYDAVLMDCQMPVLDGFQATEQIRRLPAPLNTIPVIALTASALASDEQRCRAAGMDEFLTKPIRPQRLDATLRDLLPGRVPEPDSVHGELLEARTLRELQELGPGFTDRILPRYLRNAPATAAAITAAAVREDLVEVARLAHKFRGSSATLAGRRLAATCSTLEQAANRGDIGATIDLTRTVERQTRATCDALRAALPPAVPG